jgi:hypothetical protein
MPLQVAEAAAFGRHFVEFMIDGRLMLGSVPTPGSPFANQGANAAVLLCGDRCVASLQRGLRNDEARARGEMTHRLEPTKRMRREAERLLSRVCGWCLTPVASNTPVASLFATLKGDGDRADRAGGLMSVTIGGRLVPGWSPEIGSEAAVQGCDIAFMLCGEDCARKLEAAIALDTALSVVH